MKQITHTPDEKEPTNRYVDAPFLGRKYHVTGRYILQMAAVGRIPCIRLGKKCVRFSEAAVAAALEGGSR